MPSIFFKISTRIYALSVLALCLVSLLALVLLSRTVNDAYTARSDELHTITDTAISLLVDLENGVQSGKFTPEQAREIGRERLHALRFGDHGYVFALDHDLVIQAHPTIPDWVGTEQGDYEDVTGIKIFQEMEKIASAKGAGDLKYYFKRPGSDEIEVKASYVQVYKPWGWIIGTGVYGTEIEAKIFKLRSETLFSLAIILLSLSIAAYFIIKSVTGPLKKLCTRMLTMEKGDNVTAIPCTESRSELGEMARTLDVFRGSLARQREMETQQRERDAEQSEAVEVLSEKLSQLSQGDLSARISGDFPQDYEQLRVDFNHTAETLNVTVAEVIDAASSIRNGATEISQASDDLSRRTESQAATLEETAAALDELTASVKSAAQGARSVETAMNEAGETAARSGTVVQNAVAAMNEIAQSSSHISQILSVIDDIAFQTNLLALNAGVEAARAGEAGRGFAVVAAEVRALALRSSDAALEIKTLISDSSLHVERGVDQVGQTGEVLQAIVGQVKHIAQLVTGIAEGAAEQSTGLQEINTGMSQLDQVTQQNAAMVEEATAAGHMLNSDAGNLSEVVARFNIGTTTTAAQSYVQSSTPNGGGFEEGADPVAPSQNSLLRSG
ncbi:methyl-accepting chemotaxis protein [Pseudophaeobacter sp.]|jgi:methyl-accepting chemotaxis protein|uniref:methyl-accepting chemotaxis protein n=1 Tax=Pseudophaeobacter sp. TaxID=1971739 RepID=UPI0032D933A4